MINAPGAIVLTHDVDYLPTRANRGMPRFLRAVLRQLISRRSATQAWQIISKYRTASFQPMPYNALKAIADEETILGAISSFQFTIKLMAGAGAKVIPIGGEGLYTRRRGPR
ncbi:MAG: hypothetical protein ACXWMV_13890, partial [Syntrophales bacterium]